MFCSGSHANTNLIDAINPRQTNVVDDVVLWFLCSATVAVTAADLGLTGADQSYHLGVVKALKKKDLG